METTDVLVLLEMVVGAAAYDEREPLDWTAVVARAAIEEIVALRANNVALRSALDRLGELTPSLRRDRLVDL